MASLADLAERLTIRARTLDQIASDKTVAAAAVILRDLGTVTPKDVSTAVSNWQVALNAANVTPIVAYIPGKKGSTAQASAAEMVDAGLAVLQRKRPGDTVHITNGLPYIRRLNDGYSKQAPAGFVERATLLARPYRVTVRVA